MKRVTILAESCELVENGRPRGLVMPDGGAHGLVMPDGAVAYFRSEYVLAVEDHVEPLPTEPGTRFWGSFDKTAPCWWFVTKERGTEGVWYVSQHGTRDRHPSGMNSTSIAVTEGRLVRLPDPEVTA